MAPFEIRNETLKQLRRTRTAMNSIAWLNHVRAQDAQTQRQAAMTALNVHLAILELENAQLDGIRTALVANEAALTQGGADLDGALARLDRVADVLQTAGQVLRVIGKVVSLL